jgi:hypothetical protein
MKSIRSSMLFKVFILAIGVLGASAGSAHAQAASGTFTLAHEARWGTVVLPAGGYMFSLQSPGMPATIVVRQTNGSRVAMVLPRAVSEEKLESTSRLVLSHNERGESFVSALYLGDIGVGLHYGQPKTEMSAPETAKLGPITESQPGK